MSRFPSPQNPSRSYGLDYSSVGDRSAVASFFNNVYAWMSAGLALTAVVAWYVSSNQALFGWLYGTGIWIGLFVLQLVLVFTISAAVNRLSPTAATALFLLYAALSGLTFSVVFLAYTFSSIAGTFFATAGTFGAMSIYGYVTKRDLTRLGSLLFMALIGLIIASVVNIFWANSTMYWVITYAGILIFVGLTAYDTQRLREVAIATANDPRMAARYAINGALTLYLDFINLFLMLLRILGDRR